MQLVPLRSGGGEVRRRRRSNYYYYQQHRRRRLLLLLIVASVGHTTRIIEDDDVEHERQRLSSHAVSAGTYTRPHSLATVPTVNLRLNSSVSCSRTTDV